MLAQARYEDLEVQQQIEELLGVTIEAHEGKNGDSLSLEWASPTWWQQIVSGPDELQLTQAQAAGLFRLVVEEILEREDEDNEDVDDDEVSTQLPAGPITLGDLRAQLQELSSLLDPNNPSPFEILEQKYELIVYEDTKRKQARAQAHQFISRHLLLPLDRHTTLINERRQVLTEISRHINILERLQAKRLGEPVSVDVNVTGRVQGD